MQKFDLSELSALQGILCSKPSAKTAFNAQLLHAVQAWVDSPDPGEIPGTASTDGGAGEQDSPPSSRGLLLVLDEVPALFAGMPDPINLLQRLLKDLNSGSNSWRGPVLMVATACTPAALPSDWRSISPVVLHMTPPDEQQRRDIFLHALQAGAPQHQQQQLQETAQELANSTAAFCASDLAHVISSSRHLQGSVAEVGQAMAHAAATHTPMAVLQLQHSGLPCKPVPPSAQLTLDSIGGAADAKAALQEALVWPRLHPGLLAAAGISPARGILLYGPPGTGKTLLAKAAAGSLGVPFLPVGISDIMRPQVGESQKLIAQVFALARSAAPCVLFLDEVQALFSSRQGGGGAAHSSAVQLMEHQLTTQLLTEMNDLGGLPGVGVVVIAATNAPEALDSALLRPGRLERCIHVGLPDVDAREDILDHLLQGVDVDAAVGLRSIAERCEGMTGADLSGVVQVARGLALKEVMPPVDVSDPLGVRMSLEGHLAEAMVCHEHLYLATLRVSPSVSAASAQAMAAWK